MWWLCMRMCMRACACVCMCVCAYACMCVCVRMCAGMHACSSTLTSPLLSIYACEGMHLGPPSASYKLEIPCNDDTWKARRASNRMHAKGRCHRVPAAARMRMCMRDQRFDLCLLLFVMHEAGNVKHYAPQPHTQATRPPCKEDARV